MAQERMKGDRRQLFSGFRDRHRNITGKREMKREHSREVFLRTFGHEHKCAYCNQNLIPGTLTIDHVVPLQKGGSFHIDNCVAACVKCNNSKGASLVEEMIIGHSRWIWNQIEYYRRMTDRTPTAEDLVEFVAKNTSRPRGVGILTAREMLRRWECRQ